MKRAKPSSEPPGEKPSESATLIPGLPNEVGLGVLVRLPLLFQARYQLVCRSWKQAMEAATMRASRKRLHISEVWLVSEELHSDGTCANVLVNVNDGHICRIAPTPPQLRHRSSSLHFSYFGIIGYEVLIAVQGAVPFEDSEVEGLYSFDVAHMEWIDGMYASLPARRVSLSAVDMDGGYAYAASGHGSGMLMRLDLKTKMWEDLPDPHVKRKGFGGVVLKNHFWIMGGQAQNGDWCDSGEIWDPINREWTLVPQLWDVAVFGRWEWPMLKVAVLSDRLYATARGHSSSTLLMYYEDSSKVWKSLGAIRDSQLGDISGFLRLSAWGEDCLYVAACNPLQVWTTRPSLSRPFSWKRFSISSCAGADEADVLLGTVCV